MLTRVCGFLQGVDTRQACYLTISHPALLVSIDITTRTQKWPVWSLATAGYVTVEGYLLLWHSDTRKCCSCQISSPKWSIQCKDGNSLLLLPVEFNIVSVTVTEFWWNLVCVWNLNTACVGYKDFFPTNTDFCKRDLIRYRDVCANLLSVFQCDWLDHGILILVIYVIFLVA